MDTVLNRYDLILGVAEIDAGLDLGYSFNGSAPEMGAREKHNAYYVSPTGDDANNGLTTGSAWASIDNGNALLFPGDTVHVMPGTYTTAVVLDRSGMSNDPIVYAGIRDSTTVDGSGISDVVTITGKLVTWSGINIRNALTLNMKIDGDTVIVEDSRIENSADHGIQAKNASQVFRRNVFSGNPPL